MKVTITTVETTQLQDYHALQKVQSSTNLLAEFSLNSEFCCCDSRSYCVRRM